MVILQVSNLLLRVRFPLPAPQKPLSQQGFFVCEKTKYELYCTYYMMMINDKVYSKFEITSQAVLELINTPAFQRIKSVSQFGIPDKYFYINGFSRYDHCLGVYIFLNKLGASEEEQIAGLLHDVSHTAFSHLIDWVIGDNQKEDYQDKRHLSVLKEKEISEILEKYGLTAEQMSDYHKFGLLEREIPDVCADRVDYALRESSPEVIAGCLPYFRNYNGEMVFATEEAALLFAKNFLKLQADRWGGYETMTRYTIFANLLKEALGAEVIVLQDFFRTDNYVIGKLLAAKDKRYTNTLKLLENKNLDFLKKPGTATVKKKFRYVDPKILKGETCVILSEVNPGFKRELEISRAQNEQGVIPGAL